MAHHTATIRWNRGSDRFAGGRYSRGHVWEFDGGARVAASSSPHIVPVPFSVPEAVDPEEAFVASLASCHMLWFLSLAASAGVIVDDYEDAAVGTLEEVEAGRWAMTRVQLRPCITFGGDRRPSAEEHVRLHHEAHDRCYLARAVRAEITCDPVAVEVDRDG